MDNNAQPAKAKFAVGDLVEVDVNGVPSQFKVAAITPIGVADDTGETVKYTISQEGGAGNYGIMQYVPESKLTLVEANDAGHETLENEVDKSEDAPENSQGTPVAEHDGKDLDGQEKKDSSVQDSLKEPTGDQPNATDANHTGELAPVDPSQPGSPANNPDLNGAIEEEDLKSAEKADETVHAEDLPAATNEATREEAVNGEALKAEQADDKSDKK